MDEDPSGIPAQQASPAKGGRGGKAKARGGRAAPRGKAKVSKGASNARQANARGRRQKVYEFIKAQAAHERMAELKAQFTQLARAMKPALNELADRTIAKLTSNPKAHEEVPEAREVHQFLDRRLEDTIKTTDNEHHMQVSNAEKLFKLNTQLARDECTVSSQPKLSQNVGHLC